MALATPSRQAFPPTETPMRSRMDAELPPLPRPRGVTFAAQPELEADEGENRKVERAMRKQLRKQRQREILEREEEVQRLEARYASRDAGTRSRKTAEQQEPVNIRRDDYLRNARTPHSSPQVQSIRHVSLFTSGQAMGGEPASPYRYQSSNLPSRQSNESNTNFAPAAYQRSGLGREVASRHLEQPHEWRPSSRTSEPWQAPKQQPAYPPTTIRGYASESPEPEAGRSYAHGIEWSREGGVGYGEKRREPAASERASQPLTAPYQPAYAAAPLRGYKIPEQMRDSYSRHNQRAYGSSIGHGASPRFADDLSRAQRNSMAYPSEAPEPHVQNQAHPASPRTADLDSPRRNGPRVRSSRRVSEPALGAEARTSRTTSARVTCLCEGLPEVDDESPVESIVSQEVDAMLAKSPPLSALPSSTGNRPQQPRSVSTPVEKVLRDEAVRPAVGLHMTLDEMEEDVTCSICLQVIVAAHGMSPCGHTICGGCANEWIREKSTCPACRAELTKDAPFVPLLGMDAIISKWVRKQGPEWDGLADWQERCEMWQAHRAFNEQPPAAAAIPAAPLQDDPFSNWVHQDFGSISFEPPLRPMDSGSFMDRHDRAMVDMLTSFPTGPRIAREMLFPSSFTIDAVRDMIQDSFRDRLVDRLRGLRL